MSRASLTDARLQRGGSGFTVDCMAPTLALLASPFLGPTVWQPVAELLTRWGMRVIAAPAASAPPRTAADVLEGFLEALPADHEQEFVLVPHSNAGLYVPALASQRRVKGFVFVDALLPAPGGRSRLAPPAALLDVLRSRADEHGLLPPWSAWWEEAGVAGLFPDRSARERVEGEQQRVPLSYFEGSDADTSRVGPRSRRLPRVRRYVRRGPGGRDQAWLAGCHRAGWSAPAHAVRTRTGRRPAPLPGGRRVPTRTPIVALVTVTIVRSGPPTRVG